MLAALGQFYAVEKRWDESIDHLKRAAEAAPNVPVYRHQYAVALGLFVAATLLSVWRARAASEAQHPKTSQATSRPSSEV